MYGAKQTFFWKEQSFFIHTMGIPWSGSGFYVDLAYFFLLLFIQKSFRNVASWTSNREENYINDKISVSFLNLN